MANKIRIILFGVLVLLASANLQATASPKQIKAKPNVIIILADDVGYGDIGAYGATKVKTPNIDQLARQGVSFMDAHAASAVCSPSRYGLLTGEYPARENFWLPVFAKDSLMIETSQMTLARLMKDKGYATAVIGKWHLGFGNKRPVDWNKPLKPGPLEVGFDYYFGVPVLNSHPPFVYVENHSVVGAVSDDPMVYGEIPITREFDEKFIGTLPGELSVGGAKAAHALYEDREIGTTLKNKAIEWITNHKDSPFFLYFTPTNIHHPFTPAPQFIGTSEAGPYGDSIHELDWMVGEIMATLEQEGLADNTLIIFTSDNGGMFNRGGQTAWEAGHKLNGDLLGMKFGAWEGGHRVPLIVRWPGQAPAGEHSAELLSHVDMLATIAEIIEHPLEKGEGPDSYNMLPTFKGISAKPIRDHLVVSPARKSHLAIRQGKWVYIGAQGEGGFGETRVGQHGFGGAAALEFTGQINSDVEDGKIKENAPLAQLYDLEKDPYQTENVHDKFPDVAKEMKALLKRTMM